MTAEEYFRADVKQEVRQFYDQVGWSLVGDDLYQNARYEDLRLVAREYIQRCHARVGRHLSPGGVYLLDAGSGPIQYPAYLEYSRHYRYRVCADISITALKEARRRIADHGLFVVADVANLPFKSNVFDGIVSLHTVHHLPEDEHLSAYLGFHRLLAPGKSAIVVNGWPSSRLMEKLEPLVRLSNRLRSFRKYSSAIGRLRGRSKSAPPPKENAGRTQGPSQLSTTGEAAPLASNSPEVLFRNQPKGTFTSRHNVAWMKDIVGGQMPLEILVWRSASVRFLRAVIQPWLGGRYWLRLLYWLEERNPHYYGENGQYPLIIIRKL